MSPLTGGLLGIGLLLLLMALRMPIGIAMAVAGFLGTVYYSGIQGTLPTLGMVPFSTATTYTLTAIPLFVLMGYLAFASGISGDLYDAAFRWLGRVPGGLAITTLSASALFAAACGSSTAATAAMATIALPEMRRHKYSSRLSVGCLAVGGTLAILIPPSIFFIIYGVLTEQSIGKLFMAGIIPGIILTCLYIGVVCFWAKLNPLAAPPAAVSFTLREKMGGLYKVWGMLALVFLVLGGIYLGWFTPTEGAAVGSMGALLLTAVKGRFNRHEFMASLGESVNTTCMILTILIGAMIFGHFLALTRAPVMLAQLLSGLQVGPYGVVAIIVLILLILGCFMDALPIIVLTLPIFFPVIVNLGFDPIWFGVVMCVTIETGLITPPVGMNVFVMSGMAPDIPMSEICRGVLPFLPALMIELVLLVAFPGLALFLPSLMYGR